MFHRRRGSSAAPPVDRNTSSNATNAAQLAFLSTSKSASSLSSAAAAAALRSHTTSPEPVGSIQTKRMVRRGSTSSNGSGNNARGFSPGRPALQRSNSNGSMTERTFRSPSPARTQTNGTMSPSSPGSDVPPVPAIPRLIHKRSSSLDPPQRITSPTPQEGKRGSSVDRVAAQPPPGTSRHAKRLSNVAEAEETERANAARNFSRPMSPTQNSPTATGATNKYTHGSGSWFTQPSTSDTPIKPRTAEGPPSYGSPTASPNISLSSSNRNRVSSSQGSHLARANQGQSRNFTSPPGSSYETEESVMTYDPNSRTFIRKTKERAVEPSSPVVPKATEEYDPNTRTFVPKAESGSRTSSFTTAVTVPQNQGAAAPMRTVKKTRPTVPAVDTAVDAPAKRSGRLSPSSASPNSPRSFAVLQKQPSVVREDYDAEKRAEASVPASSEPRTNSLRTQTSTEYTKAYATSTVPHQRSTSLDVPRLRQDAGRGRNISISPSRSAHFSPSPVLEPQVHVPPARGVSPVKSAMKQSPASSVRTASPMGAFSLPGASITGNLSSPSETSEDTNPPEALSSLKKKKSVRVSFDEQPREIALAAAAMAPDTAGDLVGEDDDGMMKSRPALPSFGSVRGTRVQPDMAQKVTETPPERHGTSSDHAIGGILRNSLAPLPPEVTSKETVNYSSDESSDYEVPAVSAAANPEPAKVGAGLDVSRDVPRDVSDDVKDTNIQDFAQNGPTTSSEEQDYKENANLPAINLLPPTPGLESESNKELSLEHEDFVARSKSRSSMEVVVPGSWAHDDEVESKTSTEPHATQNVTSSSLQGLGIERQASAEGISATQMPTSIDVSDLPTPPQQLSDIDEDSDDSDAFSDAVEDPSELEDDGGFASLDAIVESPVATPPSVMSRGVPTWVLTDEPPASPSPLRTVQNADENKASGNDWGQATAYWSQLSKEKREQMEKEQLPASDAGKTSLATATMRGAKPKVAATGAPKQAARSRQVTPPAQQDSAQPVIRKTMRAQPGPTMRAQPGPTMRAQPVPAPVDDGGVHMRRSMRSGGGSMTTSLREGPPSRRPQSEYIEPRGTLQKKIIRPMSSGGLSSSSVGSTLPAPRPTTSDGRKSQDASTVRPTVTTQQPPQVSARLQRELAKADDSDSESSFKKRRKGSMSTTDTQGRYSMRRSMRGASIDQTPVPAEPRRPMSPTTDKRDKSGFRLRSMSPPKSFFGRNKVEAVPAEPSPRTTMRGAPAAKDSSSSRLGSSTKPTAATAPPKPSRFKSRFVDSDDSDDDDRPKRGGHFKSRFGDSDEDEPGSPAVIPADLTPVRGIPRRKGQEDGDSTDLEDEDEDDSRKASRKREKMQLPLVPSAADVEKAMAAAQRNLGISVSTPQAPHTPHDSKEGSALARGSMRNTSEVERPEPKSRPQDVALAPPEKKKKGFMGGFLRRNRNSSSSVQQIAPSNPASVPVSLPVASPAPVPATPPVAPPAYSQAIQQETPASPKTPTPNKLIRRTSNQPKTDPVVVASAASPETSAATSTTAGKEAENWPLPSPRPESILKTPVEASRPTTSDGFSPEAIRLARTMRPDIGRRTQSGQLTGHSVRIQAGEEGTEPGERDPKAVYSRRTGKKKKFGALRRFVGMDD